MPFPRRLLNEDEEVVLDLRPHWWFLSGPVALVVVLAGATVSAALVDLADWLPLIPLAGTGLALLWLAGRWARWNSTSFVVTTERLIYRSGVFSKRGMEIPLGRVHNIAFSQALFERLLRSGDLVIESAGQTGQQRFTDIPRPTSVQYEIYRQMDIAAERAAGAGSHLGEPSIADQLEKLDELRRRGVISRAEFEAKKAQLLERW